MIELTLVQIDTVTMNLIISCIVGIIKLFIYHNNMSIQNKTITLKVFSVKSS